MVQLLGAAERVVETDGLEAYGAPCRRGRGTSTRAVYTLRIEDGLLVALGRGRSTISARGSTRSRRQTIPRRIWSKPEWTSSGGFLGRPPFALPDRRPVGHAARPAARRRLSRRGAAGARRPPRPGRPARRRRDSRRTCCTRRDPRVPRPLRGPGGHGAPLAPAGARGGADLARRADDPRARLQHPAPMSPAPWPVHSSARPRDFQPRGMGSCDRLLDLRTAVLHGDTSASRRGDPSPTHGHGSAGQLDLLTGVAAFREADAPARDRAQAGLQSVARSRARGRPPAHRAPSRRVLDERLRLRPGDTTINSRASRSDRQRRRPGPDGIHRCSRSLCRWTTRCAG